MPKLPFAIATKDGRPFTFAGLWEGWKDPESGEWLRTCTIITGEPNELVAQIHPRMPVILPPATSCGLARGEGGWKRKRVTAPYPADQMRMWEISPRVNSAEQNLCKYSEVTIWTKGVFGLNMGSLEALVQATDSFDLSAIVYCI
jgi:putative SOS response-associated peptidase YedK